VKFDAFYIDFIVPLATALFSKRCIFKAAASLHAAISPALINKPTSIAFMLLTLNAVAKRVSS